MTALSIIVSVILPWFAGFMFVQLILRGQRLCGVFEKVFLGYGFGMGILSLEMFALGLLRIPFTLSAAVAPLIALTALLLFLFYRAGGRKKEIVEAGPLSERIRLKGWMRALSYVLLSGVALKTAFVFSEAALRPLFSTDAWSNWSSGAKLFYYNKGLLLDAGENFFGGGYRPFLGHPFLNTLIQVWNALCLGGWDEVYVKFFEPFYFISLLVVFFCGVKREAGLFYAASGVFFLSALPLLTFHALDAYSDLPLAFYAFVGALFFWRHLAEDKKEFLILSGFFLGFAALTKNEGIFYAIAVVFSLVLFIFFRKKAAFASLLYLLIPFGVITSLWFGFKLANGIGFGHGGAASGMKWLSDPKYGGEVPKGVHWVVIPVFLREVFLRSSSGLLFPFFLIISIIGIKTAVRTEIKYLYCVVIAVMAMFMVTYLLLEVTAVIEITGVHRNIMTYAPIMFFSSLALLSRLGAK